MRPGRCDGQQVPDSGSGVVRAKWGLAAHSHNPEHAATLTQSFLAGLGGTRERQMSDASVILRMCFSAERSSRIHPTSIPFIFHPTSPHAESGRQRVTKVTDQQGVAK